jgi:hypothetical protein
MSESDPGPAWRKSAERLLEAIPGVVSATIEGSRDAVSAVRVWYEPTWPAAQVMAAVDECLIKQGARLAATRFQAVVAQPDRRATRRERPDPAPEPAASPETPPDTFLRLAGHKIDEVQRGVMGVQVWIEWQGRTFSGAAVGPSAPAGALRTPAVATLRALHSLLQVLYEGPRQPGLVLENVVRITVEKAPVVVVALTASEKARPMLLTAAWADEGEPGLPVIMATLHATSRTVIRWMKEQPSKEQPPPDSGPSAPAGSRPVRIGTPEKRLILSDVAVDHGPSGELDVGVRLAGFGETVAKRRNGPADEAGQLEAGASATFEAVHELLKVGGLSGRHGKELRHAGAYRLRTGEHDIVVVVAEATIDGRNVRLAGSASADSGLERAAIAAALQATNPLVAHHVANTRPGAGADEN